MMLRRKTFFMLLKNVFLISTIVDCGFFCKRGKRFPYHMNFLGDVYMNLNYHLAGQTWSIPCPCVFSPPHKLTSSHCKHFLYSSPSLCTKSWSRINLRSFSFLYLQINPNSKAYVEGIKVGDLIELLNGQKTEGLLHNDVQQLIKIASGELALQLNRFVVIIELKL